MVAFVIDPADDRDEIVSDRQQGMADVGEDLVEQPGSPRSFRLEPIERGRAIWATVLAGCWFVVIGGVWLAVSLLFGITQPVVTVVGQATMPLVLLAVWPVAAVAAWRRRWVLTGIATGLVVVHIAVVLPAIWPHGTPSWAAQAPTVRVLSANVKIDNPTEDRAASALLAVDADVLVVVELTPHFITELRSHGAYQQYPNRVERPQPWDGRGIGIYSKLPMTAIDAIDLDGRQAPGARLTLADGTTVNVYGVHTVAPYEPLREGRWRDNLTALADRIAELPKPFVLAGDFNATRWHPPFTTLLDAGVRDAHEQTGNGLSFSWPADRGLLPPLFRLDHALLSDGVTATALHEVTIPGSDHVGFVVDLAVRAH